MADLIALILLLGSLFGIIAMISRKMPLLDQIARENPVKKTGLLEMAGNWVVLKADGIPVLRDFSHYVFLQKILSKIRIMTLKIEAKIGNYLQSLRERSLKKHQESASDGYWEDLRSLIKSREPRKNVLGRPDAGSPENGAQNNAAAAKSEEPSRAAASKAPEVKIGLKSERKPRKKN
jgi:hypothetical protein